MKYPFLMVLGIFSTLYSSAASCNREENNIQPNTVISHNTTNENMTSNTITISIGTKTFTATLPDHPSAKAFREMLPISLNMTELNGNEKYADLARSLPTDASHPGTMQNGDLMLYGSATLVLFYKTFPTSYTYTRLGHIQDVNELAEALGTENISVTFELKKE